MAVLCENNARECTGCMGCQTEEDDDYLGDCPSCGEPIGRNDVIYLNADFEIIACSECLIKRRASDEEFFSFSPHR